LAAAVVEAAVQRVEGLAAVLAEVAAAVVT